MLGKLLLLITDVRTLSHLFDYHNYKRLNEFLDVLPEVNPVLKEYIEHEGRAYSVLSSELVNYICDGVTYDPYLDNHVYKRGQKPKEKQVQRLKESLGFHLFNFRFFRPPPSDTTHSSLRTTDHLEQFEQPLNLCTGTNDTWNVCPKLAKKSF